MRTVVMFVAFWIYLVAVLPTLLASVICTWCGRDRLALRIGQWQSSRWGRFLVRLSGARLRILGLEKLPKEGGVVIAANHQGAFDIPLVLGHLGRPVAFVAKQELRRVPLMGRWMVQMGCEFLDRDNTRQGLEVVKRCRAFLEAGGAMVVFPEGTRSRGGPLGEFKRGSLHMAVKGGFPVVPLTIVDSYRLREGNGGAIRPAAVTLVVDEPIDPAALDREAQKDLAETVRMRIAENLAQYSLPVEASSGAVERAPGEGTGELI